MTPRSEHKIIWLAPECDDGSEGRAWCEDNIWDAECACGKGHKPVRYLLADAQPKAEAIHPQDWRTLLASLIRFGRSQDGSVERDLEAAIERAIAGDQPKAEASDLERAQRAIEEARAACRAGSLAIIGSSHIWHHFENAFASALASVRAEAYAAGYDAAVGALWEDGPKGEKAGERPPPRWRNDCADYLSAHRPEPSAPGKTEAALKEAWQPIEIAIEIAKSNDGWIPVSLFAIERQWGWEVWVGQCDAGTIWLGRSDDGDCWDCEKPTHWMPLPAPLSRASRS